MNESGAALLAALKVVVTACIGCGTMVDPCERRNLEGEAICPACAAGSASGRSSLAAPPVESPEKKTPGGHRGRDGGAV